MAVNHIELLGINDLPNIKEGDNLTSILLDNARRHTITLDKSDILIITQKIVSKAEGRLIDLRAVIPTQRAKRIARLCGKKPELIQLILNESQEVLRIRKGLIIVRHKLGFVCANAGIDHSNTIENDPENNFVLLLPEDPDASARRIQDEIERQTGLEVGVLIIDSHGRAWRNGTVGTTIGIAGVPGVVDLRGTTDLFGYTLRATQVAAADELAAAASLLMGQADEGIPCVIARGFPYPLRDSKTSELIRSKKYDLFK